MCGEDIMEFIPISKEHRDCTVDFEVKFKKPFTVRDLVNYLTICKCREHGFVSIKNIPFSFEYKWGYSQRIPQEYLELEIAEIKARGGYSLMDYDIKTNKRD